MPQQRRSTTSRGQSNTKKGTILILAAVFAMCTLAVGAWNYVDTSSVPVLGNLLQSPVAVEKGAVTKSDADYTDTSKSVIEGVKKNLAHQGGSYKTVSEMDKQVDRSATGGNIKWHVETIAFTPDSDFSATSLQKSFKDGDIAVFVEPGANIEYEGNEVPVYTVTAQDKLDGNLISMRVTHVYVLPASGNSKFSFLKKLTGQSDSTEAEKSAATKKEEVTKDGKETTTTAKDMVQGAVDKVKKTMRPADIKASELLGDKKLGNAPLDTMAKGGEKENTTEKADSAKATKNTDEKVITAEGTTAEKVAVDTLRKEDSTKEDSTKATDKKEEPSTKKEADKNVFVAIKDKIVETVTGKKAEPVVETKAVKDMKETKEDKKDTSSKTATKGKAKLAIVLDDFGYQADMATTFNEMGIPLTYAVMPYKAHSQEVANIGAKGGQDIILHLPMESISGEGAEEVTIKTGMSDQEIKNIVNKALASVPHARGVNNHQGSKATSDPRVMKDVLGILKNDGLFYVDSRTSAGSIGYKTACSMGVPTGMNELFIDNSSEVADIEARLQEGANLALHSQSGYAVIIGHARPNTAKALKNMISKLKSQGIEFVFVRNVVG